MIREEIENTVREIMIKDGPDGHTDGFNIITDFILALMSGNGEKWSDEYINGSKI